MATTVKVNRPLLASVKKPRSATGWPDVVVVILYRSALVAEPGVMAANVFGPNEVSPLNVSRLE